MSVRQARTTLERLVGDGKTPQKIVARARIVLLSGRGLGTNSIQREAQRQTQANSILEKNARGGYQMNESEH